ENDARVDLGWQGRRIRAPRHGVEIGATGGTVADADHVGDIFNAELERGDGRILADLLGNHLVDSGAGANVLTGSVLGQRAAEPGGATGGVARASLLALVLGEIAEDIEAVAEGFERLQDGRDFVVGAGCLGNPFIENDAVGRSEERRVGKEWRSGWGREPEREKI